MFGAPKEKHDEPTQDEVGLFIDRLERILSQKETDFDWEDMSISFDDERAEALRLLFHQVSDAFHGEGIKCYSSQGMDVLKAILDALKKERSK